MCVCVVLRLCTCTIVYVERTEMWENASFAQTRWQMSLPGRDRSDSESQLRGIKAVIMALTRKEQTSR